MRATGTGTFPASPALPPDRLVLLKGSWGPAGWHGDVSELPGQAWPCGSRWPHGVDITSIQVTAVSRLAKVTCIAAGNIAGGIGKDHITAADPAQAAGLTATTSFLLRDAGRQPANGVAHQDWLAGACSRR
jgi:hypothetical protein